MPRLHLFAAGLSALSALTVLCAPATADVAPRVAGAMNAPMSLPMHQHPSGSTDRVTPGAVRIEAESHVTIDLLDDRGVLEHEVAEYDTPIGKGSGFTVTPDGVVVTATEVLKTGDDPRVYAVNRVFAKHYKVKIPADFDEHKLKDAELNARLQNCYPDTAAGSDTCLTKVTTKVTVFPYENSTDPEGLPAKILHLGDAPASAAVLQITKGVDDETMPTVPLATSMGAKVEATDLMTLPSRPTAKQPPLLTTTHQDPPGSGTFKVEDQPKILEALKDDGDGGALIDDVSSEVVALVAGGKGDQIIVTPAEDIRSALVSANVTPRRGQVDVVFETALASYHNKYYARAIPVLQQVLKLRNDHPVASDHLKVAQAKAGTAEDAGTRVKPAKATGSSSGISPWLWVAGGVVLAGLLVAFGLPIVLRRRGGQGEEGVTRPDGLPALPPGSSWPPQHTELMELARPAETGGLPPQAVPYPRGTDPFPAPVPASGSATGPAAGPLAGGVKFCTQCGMRLGHGHRFCGFCGTAVEQ